MQVRPLAALLLLGVFGLSSTAPRLKDPPPIVPPPGIHMQKVGDPVSMPDVTAAALQGRRVYAVYNGMPPWIVAARSDGSVFAKAEIPEGYNAWAVVVAPDGTAYTATTSNTANHVGYLWRWRPGQAVHLVATLPGVLTVWALAIDPRNGDVWIGAHQRLLAYSPANHQLRDYGMVVPGEVDVHTVSVADGSLYLGLTPRAEVVRFDPRTDRATPLVSNADTSSIRAISTAPDGSLIVTWGSQALFTYREGVATGYLNHAISAPIWWHGTSYTFQGDGTIAVGVYHTWRNPPVILKPQPDYASWGAALEAAGRLGSQLAAVFSNGYVFRYDSRVQRAMVSVLNFQNPSPGIIHALAIGPDGSLWASVYLGGEVTRVMGQTFEKLPFPLQADAFAFAGKMLYIGAYPGAYLYAYDWTKPWQLGINPVAVGRVQVPGTPQQDRAFALAAGPDGVYLGTIPESGTLDGNLGYYDPARRILRVFDSPVPDQGITSLLWVGHGLLIGTTTAFGGGDVPPTGRSGAVFLWDTRRESLLRTIFPIPGMRVWGGLVATPYGIFGANANAVFRLDPRTFKITTRVLDLTAPPDRWDSLTHMFYWRGKVFLLTEGRLEEIDPHTLAATKLFLGAEQATVQGDTLFLSYHESAELVKVPLARLTPQNIVYPPHYIEWMDAHPNLIP